MDFKTAKTLLFYFAITSTYVIFALFIGFVYNFSALKVFANQNKGAMYSHIIIDPGHGGVDGGASSEDGTLEKDINLSISLKLKEVLLASGFSVSMTRESDVSICDKDSKTIGAKKKSDILKRVKISNSSANNILISVHQNKFEDQFYGGAQVFYSQKNKDSKLLASKLQNVLKEDIDPSNKREIKPSNSNIFLLENVSVPAVIVECGFMSNKKDLENMKDEEFQKKMAFTIGKGIIEFFNTPNQT